MFGLGIRLLNPHPTQLDVTIGAIGKIVVLRCAYGRKLSLNISNDRLVADASSSKFSGIIRMESPNSLQLDESGV